MWEEIRILTSPLWRADPSIMQHNLSWLHAMVCMSPPKLMLKFTCHFNSIKRRDPQCRIRWTSIFWPGLLVAFWQLQLQSWAPHSPASQCDLLVFSGLFPSLLSGSLFFHLPGQKGVKKSCSFKSQGLGLSQSSFSFLVESPFLALSLRPMESYRTKILILTVY